VQVAHPFNNGVAFTGGAFSFARPPMPKIPTRGAAALDEVIRYMRRHRIKPADLVDYGGQDLRDPDPLIRATAGAVSRTWGHMARLRVTIDDITAAWQARAAA
jgi:hypothetical protein